MSGWAVLLAAVVAFATAGGGQAQALAGPKEQPPAGFTGPQFVDSHGCVFLRAGRGAQGLWVERLDADRAPMCGYAPTVFAPEAVAESGTATKPEVEPEAETAMTPSDAAPVVTDVAPELSIIPRVAAQQPARPPTADLVVIPPAVPSQLRPWPVPVGERWVAANFAPPPSFTRDPRQTRQSAAPETETGATARAETAPAKHPGSNAAGIKKSGAKKVCLPRKVGGPSKIGTSQIGGIYIQVGVYRVRANAQGAVSQLANLGLPAGERRVGKCLRSIHAGPFQSRAEATKALAAVRRAGFTDAYIR